MLSRACEELSWLLDRDYPKDTARDFVGDRYQLTARQRLMLARAVSGRLAADRRDAKRVRSTLPPSRRVVVDGFNAIVTMEVALTGGPVVVCQDGTMRDLAGMRGTYHPCDQTREAVRMLLRHLEDAGAVDVDVLIDTPVSNSARLRAIVLEEASDHAGLKVTASLDRCVDATLLARGGVVVTSDSAVLDRCALWMNAVAEIIGRIAGAWLICPNMGNGQ